MAGQRKPDKPPRPCVEVFRGQHGDPLRFAKRWYWRLVARNGEVIADGSENYTRKADAAKAARRAGKLMATAPVVTVEGT
jgi:uncharacterized protein YegP (UPF0339 family)